MRRRPSKVVAVVAAVSVAALLTACEAQVHGSPNEDQPAAPHLTLVAPDGPSTPLPQEPVQPAATFDGLHQRAMAATADAAADGADVTLEILDRQSGVQVSNGNNRGIAIASVVKLFIADVMLRDTKPLSAEDRKLFDAMLRSSDDSAAEVFWNRYGASSIVTEVAQRYGLRGTRPPGNGRWWNTMSTAADLVRFYDMLLSGEGDLPKDKVDMIVNDLFTAAPTGLDGTQPGGTYPQRFGIPDGLPGEKVGYKQGWMCCIGPDWMHLSTGIIGTDRRYVMVIGSDQPANAPEARATITQVVTTMFPTGQI
ncbi:MAG: hypothetical protein ACSLE6_04710 [Mycobacterium sp.]